MTKSGKQDARNPGEKMSPVGRTSATRRRSLGYRGAKKSSRLVEYTRECLRIEVQRTITAKDVVKTLGELFKERGEPAFLRSDNGAPSSSSPKR